VSEKTKNADKRYNTKLLNEWLQDVDEKWMKIKRDIFHRQKREAESLQAIQKLNFEWKGKDLGFYDKASTTSLYVSDSYVPLVPCSIADLNLVDLPLN
jgi:hypothetical protein